MFILKLIFWPLILVFKLIKIVISLVGRFTNLMLGLILIAIGIVASITIVGAIIGIPLIILGIRLGSRSIFS